MYAIVYRPFFGAHEHTFLATVRVTMVKMNLYSNSKTEKCAEKWSKSCNVTKFSSHTVWRVPKWDTDNAKLKFFVQHPAFTVNLHLCLVVNAIPMLFIYHFYDSSHSCHEWLRLQKSIVNHYNEKSFQTTDYSNQ